jgi:activator of 2-hydroxyglutaryl-CoA dehydratase
VTSDFAYCGLDLGISTTDAVAEWAAGASVSLPTTRAPESAEAAVRRLLELAPQPPRKQLLIAATGVGARALPEHLCGFEVHRVSEISAIGRGGIGLGGGAEALVVSLGTGTAMVSVRGKAMTHVTPGNGVGGGTLRGLGRALLGTDDVAELSRLAGLGDRTVLDITIGEVVGGSLGGLPAQGTASNFAKYAEGARREDVAAALVNLVAEVVLWTVLLGLQASAHGRAILTGKLVLVEPVRRRIDNIGASLGGVLVVPERAEIAAALGAAWSIREGREGT